MSTLTLKDLSKRNNFSILNTRINGGVIQLKDEKSKLYKCTGVIEITKNKKNVKVSKVTETLIKNYINAKETRDVFNIEIKFGASKKLIKLTEIYKDNEFGGSGSRVGSGSRTAKEDAQLSSLQKQIKSAILESGTDHIVVKCGSKNYKVIGAETTFGTPKSDFHLIDYTGKECVWISHKDGKSAKDFQQWGGVSNKEYKTTPKDVEIFIKKILAIYGDELPKATTVAMKIKDEKLKNTAVYGIDYGKALGQQNVSILLQGTVELINKGKYYILDATNVHYNGDKMTGEFEPVLMAIYKGDRSNFGIGGARFGISPIGSRKITELIK